jgi:hypothetical protein
VDFIWKPAIPCVDDFEEFIRFISVEADVWALPSFSVYSIMRGIVVFGWSIYFSKFWIRLIQRQQFFRRLTPGSKISQYSIPTAHLHHLNCGFPSLPIKYKTLFETGLHLSFHQKS